MYGADSSEWPSRARKTLDMHNFFSQASLSNSICSPEGLQFWVVGTDENEKRITSKRNQDKDRGASALRQIVFLRQWKNYLSPTSVDFSHISLRSHVSEGNHIIFTYLDREVCMDIEVEWEHGHASYSHGSYNGKWKVRIKYAENDKRRSCNQLYNTARLFDFFLCACWHNPCLHDAGEFGEPGRTS